jgi:fructose-bisphosphate aldolase class II
MATFKLKPGVVTGSALQELFAYMKSIQCALPAINCIGTHSVNASPRRARRAHP